MWKPLLLAAALALLGVAAHAQELRFNSAQQVRTELSTLDERIKALDRDIAGYMRRLEREAPRVEGREAKLRELLASMLALAETIDEQRSAGLSTADAEADLKALQVSAVVAAQDLDEDAADRDAVIALLKAAQGNKERLEARRSYLLGSYRAAIEPVHLREVTISFKDPRDETADTYYSGRWSGDGDDAVAEDAIILMAESLADVSREVDELERIFADTERKFIQADGRWHARNADYMTSAVDVAVFTDALLELADVGVALAVSGPGWPAVLVFEGIYRPAEAIYKGNPASVLPTISDELLRARESASQQGLIELGLLPGGVDLNIPVDPAGGIGATLYRESVSELIKNGFGLGFSGLAENIAQAAIPYFRDAAQARVRTRWQVFALSRIAPTMEPSLLYKTLGGTVLEEEAEFAALMRRAVGTAGVDGLLGTLRQGRFWLEAGKGLGVGLVVTAAKVGVSELVGSDAEAIFEDLARLEIEWFVRQRNYRTASAILHFHRQVQRGLTEALSRAVAERDAADGERQLTVAGSERIVLSDWQIGEGVTLELAFSDRLLHSQYGFSAGPLYLSGPALANHRSELPAAVLAADNEPVILKVKVDAADPYDLHDGFDADPGTAARLLPNGEWDDLDQGHDMTHRITFAAPFLKLVEPPEEIRVGDTFQVAYRAPSNAREGAWIGLVPAGETPDTFPAGVADTTTYATPFSNVVAVSPDPSGSEGVAALTPLVPGRYEVRLYDRNRLGIAVARVPVCVTYANPVETVRYDPCGHKGDVEKLSESCRAAANAYIVISTFDPGGSGADGWTLAGDAGPQPEVTADGISGTDREGGSVWYWVAPPKFFGNQSGYFGRHLTYRMRVTKITKPFAAADVVIDGKDFSIALDTGELPGEQWQYFDHVLDSSAGWTVVGGGDKPATDAEICRVLSNMTGLRIRGEYHTGPDTGWLSEVALGD